MSAPQRIVRERRQYNQWVASQTLEDYALRYTASGARKSSFRVGNTALGPIAFLACEAIGGAMTISYGFPNTFWAIVAFTVLMFAIGLPIAYYAARYGVDIDLLTRGAGFGYLGSTLTSLIYASFTFLLFSVEASILSVALQLLFGIPLAIAHLVSALVVIPIAIYGISDFGAVFLITIGAFYPIVINTTQGARDVDRNWIRAALMMGAGPSDIIRRVVLPAALPSIFTGLRIGLGIGWTAVIVSEMVAVKSGLGYVLWDAYYVGRMDIVIADMVSIGLFGFLSDLAIVRLEFWALRWRRLQSFDR